MDTIIVTNLWRDECNKFSRIEMTCCRANAKVSGEYYVTDASFIQFAESLEKDIEEMRKARIVFGFEENKVDFPYAVLEVADISRKGDVAILCHMEFDDYDNGKGVCEFKIKVELGAFIRFGKRLANLTTEGKTLSLYDE